MRYPAFLPLIAVVAGLLAALALPLATAGASAAVVVALYALAAWMFLARRRWFAALAVVDTFLVAWMFATDANNAALRPPLLDVFARLDKESPVVIEGTLRQDASLSPSGGATLYVDIVVATPPGGEGRPLGANGGVIASVSGSLAASRLNEWRAGRRIRAPVTLRLPAVYRNPGLRDERLALARRGVHLFASIKSAALVEVVRRGSWWAERAADVRAFARRAIGDAVGRWSVQSAGIVTAILIGDRAGLEADTERRLQEAGTYHVIAISGGNIAILAGFLLGVFHLAGVRTPIAALATIVALLFYAQVAGGGASVVRATLMAVAYLAALAIDVRGASVNALCAAAATILCATPLSMYDAGFALTFGATLGILVATGSLRSRDRQPGALPRRPSTLARLERHRWLRAPIALLIASAAAELSLLPVAAWSFSRVTFAGLLLNFLAIPLMAVAQLLGMAVLPLALVHPAVAAAAGFVAHVAAAGLVWTASFVEIVPILQWRVPPPPGPIVVAYYCGWALWFVAETRPVGTLRGVPLRVATRAAGAAVLAVSVVWILWSPVARLRGLRPSGLLRVTVIDVGQADAILVRFPDASSWLVDAGGSRAGGSFDVGGRVIEPVLWQHDVFGLDRFVLSHGDPDHIGGLPSLLRDFRIRSIWEGIDVPRDQVLQDMRLRAAGRGISCVQVRAGDTTEVGGTKIRVLHPGPPDWERQKIRNDDSVVLEIAFGRTAVLLTGDIGRDVERTLVQAFSPRDLRVMKVPHHGSAASSSLPFLAAVRPAAALLTVGIASERSPALDGVLARYRSLGAELFGTLADGAIELESDGEEVRISTFTGRKRTLRVTDGGK